LAQALLAQGPVSYPQPVVAVTAPVRLPPIQMEGTASGSFMAYGSAPADSAKVAHFAKHGQKRWRVSVTALLLCLLAPTVQFAVVAAVLSFSMHWSSPGLTWLIVVACAICTVACWYLAFVASRKRWNGDTTREPFWYIFLAVTMLISICFAIYLGQINWLNNVLPSKDLGDLSKHYAVNPATTPGRQLMDAGRVIFAESAHIDTKMSMGFKNTLQYCVAPIVVGEDKLKNYDYWAIGLNCCSGTGTDFHCGEYNNAHAHGGLRLLREDQREFYRLAVQQAEATYNIKSDYPMFFYWMQDPEAELDSYKSDAAKYYFLGLLCYFAGQLFLVVVSMLGYSKL